MISVIDSRANTLGWRPGRGHCVVFLGKTLYCHSISLHPSVSMCTSKFNAGVTLQWIGNPFKGGLEILLVTLCY